MSAIPGIDSKRKAISMMRAAAAVRGIPVEAADPVFQLALIAFDPEEDPSLKLNANKALARYTYQELKPTEESTESRHEGGLVISWEAPQSALPERTSRPDPSRIPELPYTDSLPSPSPSPSPSPPAEE